jgi:hypothetical protein
MTEKEDRLFSKLIAAGGFLTRAYNKYQIHEDEKMVEAMKQANGAIDSAIEILRES